MVIKMKKNSKNLKKVICVVLLLMFILCAISPKVNADGFKTGADFNSAIATNANSVIEKSAITVITIVRIIGVTIAIVMLLVIAMKYMLSSAGDRADIKKHAVAYVIGAFILFGAVGILGLLDDVAKNISTTAATS